MKFKNYGALSVGYMENDVTQTLAIFSYDTMIATATKHKDNILSKHDYYNFDSCYYSNTTRRHQGIAYSIIDSFRKYGYGFVTMCLMHSKSQSQLKKHFGYTPLKEQYNGVINTLWTE